MGGRVSSNSPSITWARCRSRPPPSPAALRARAIAVILAIAAAASAAGRPVPVSVAVPSSSGYKLTPASRSASALRRSAAAGSAAITARRSRSRNFAGVSCPAQGRIFASTSRALASLSTLVASAIRRARYKLIFPAASACPVAGSRHDNVTARSAHAAAAQSDIVSASETCPVASRHTRAGRPSSPTPMFLSAAAAREATCATAASSAACAHDASFCPAATTPVSPYSFRQSASAPATSSHPAIAGPGFICSTASAATCPADNRGPNRPPATAASSSGSSSGRPKTRLPPEHPAAPASPGPRRPPRPDHPRTREQAGRR